jgi:hypothetical protein
MHHDVYEIIKENRYKLGANVPSNSSICFYYDERWYSFSLSSSSVFVFRHGRGHMVAGFTTTYAIGTYNH